LRPIQCPMKKKNQDGTYTQCPAMLTRNEASINNHLRLSHKTTSDQRTRLRIKLLGDLREGNKEKMAAKRASREERARAKIGGIKS